MGHDVRTDSKVVIAGAESVPAWWGTGVMRHERRSEGVAVIAL
ncbi:hypothetical protein ABZV41_05580 [Streptomyces sp. NPDC005098]